MAAKIGAGIEGWQLQRKTGQSCERFPVSSENEIILVFGGSIASTGVTSGGRRRNVAIGTHW